MAIMQCRVLHFVGGETAVAAASPWDALPTGWGWIDLEVEPDECDELVDLAEHLGLDMLALRDAVEDHDLPKVDDFGNSVLVVLHGLGEERVETYELDCFLTDQYLVTVRHRSSPSIDVLWDGVQQRAELVSGGPDSMLGRLADVLTRRLVEVVNVFDARNEDLVRLALSADADFLGEITAVRADLAVLRQAVHPQREMFDVLRHSTSPLISDSGRRRFSDVFDIATRATHGADAARAALAETLEAYRGAEARQATEVTKVLTVYAAIMLPLSLVAGIFGMNFTNLPLIGSGAGWIVILGIMALVAFVSLGMFVTLGWARRPSGRGAGALLGHGLAEAARAPAHLVGAVFEIGTKPLRSIAGARRPTRRTAPQD